MGWSQDPGPPFWRVRHPPLFIGMKELSIFIDESGDFGEYDFHSPYYIIAMVMHDQTCDMTKELNKLEKELFKTTKAKILQ